MSATEMKQYGKRLLRQSAAMIGAIAIFTALTSPFTHAAEKETLPELAAVLTKIDRTLLEQNEQDIRASPQQAISVFTRLATAASKSKETRQRWI